MLFDQRTKSISLTQIIYTKEVYKYNHLLIIYTYCF